MKHSKIISAYAIDNHVLIVKFDNQVKRKYDVSLLFNKEMFEPLKNPVLFKSVKVEKGGYAVIWNDSIDISEYELWYHGQVIC
ncbi:MAG: DUF2442 domain-containing protein [Thiomargarita sp.]|nr:DUF2442 domain-containing protein [Thiomargarita sp.]